MHAGNALVIGGACDGGCRSLVQSSMTKEENTAEVMLTPEEGLPTISTAQDTSAGPVTPVGSPFSLPVRRFWEGVKSDSSGEQSRSSIATVVAG